MKRCPTCNRTYTDDRMTHCGHDGAPLMFTAYTPPGNPHAQQMPQGYPLPPGYAPQQSARWQNYPPQGYPPPAGWRAGKSGQSNTTNIVIYSVVLGVVSLGIALFFIRR